MVNDEQEDRHQQELQKAHRAAEAARQNARWHQKRAEAALKAAEENRKQEESLAIAGILQLQQKNTRKRPTDREAGASKKKKPGESKETAEQQMASSSFLPNY